MTGSQIGLRILEKNRVKNLFFPAAIFHCLHAYLYIRRTEFSCRCLVLSVKKSGGGRMKPSSLSQLCSGR